MGAVIQDSFAACADVSQDHLRASRLWANLAVTRYRGVTAVGATFRRFPSFILSNAQHSLTLKVRFCLQPIY